MAVTTVHRIGARCEGLAGLAAVRRVAGVLAVDDVARDGQDRLRVNRVAVGRVLAELLHEDRDEVHRDAVDAIVVVAILWEIAGDFVIDDQSVIAPDRFDLARA